MSRNQGYQYRLVLTDDAAGQPVLSYLSRRFDHSSTAVWQQRIRAGELSLDGVATQPEQTLRPGSVLVWNRPGWVEVEVPTSFEVIYQDDDLLVVDKPSGLPTLPGAGFLDNTLLSLVRKTHPQARPLHRLGRATSGLVLFGTSKMAASELSRNWAGVQKTYHALASGVAQQDQYTIRFPIGPVPHPQLGSVHAFLESGKASCSLARVDRRRPDSTIFEIDLQTGRPHQIRIHLACIGHPLVGDPLYAKGGKPKSDSPGLPGDGGYVLHASRLRFVHPATGSPTDLCAELPHELTAP